MSETQLIRCPACGVVNRVPLEEVALGLTPVCGRCKTRMPVYSGPMNVTDATFGAEVVHSPLPVLLGSVGAVVRAVPASRAGTRGASDRVGGESSLCQAKRRRKPHRGVTIQCPEPADASRAQRGP